MKPNEKYADEFIFDRLILRMADGSNIPRNQACVCIVPQKDKETTLMFAWDIVRDLAQWMLDEFRSLPEEETFQIIIGWSQKVRRLQGHIFKVRGLKDDMKQIAASRSYHDYAESSGATWIPMPRWEKDVFKNENGA